MANQQNEKLTRRERQIMDIIFRRGQATVTEVLEGLTDPPSYSAVRATMAVLVEKGLIRYRKDGRRFVYLPTVSKSKAQRSAIEHVLKTFFDDSAEGAVAALIEMSSSDLSPEALERLRKMIDEATEEGR